MLTVCSQQLYWFYQLVTMGNQVCCEDLREETNPVDSIERVVLTKQYIQRGKEGATSSENQQNEEVAPHALKNQGGKVQKIVLHELTPKVKETLERQMFFVKEIETIKSSIKIYKSDVYEGELDECQRPHGWGKMYKTDAAIYVGQFVHGKAEGKGAYVFPDGSYYLGEFVQNCANCEKGCFESETYKYRGGFKNNSFDGQGFEEGENYSFEGQYEKGKKVSGQLKWRAGENNYSYRGNFNDNQQFQGPGMLSEQLGTYEGDFVSGMKQGRGLYMGKNGVSYKGQYKNDKKQGFGTIYNHDGSIAYRGQFKNGRPHGKGSCFVNGKQQMAMWQQGIDTRLISSLEGH